MKTAFLLAIALVLSRPGQAQLYVYYVSGEAYLQASPKSVPLRARAAVQPGQAVQLRRDAQIVFIDQQGRSLTYSKPGPATYKTLQEAFAASNVGPSRAYLTYVWTSLRHHAPTTEALASAPLGGVARGDAPRLLAPADSAVVEKPLVAFQWQPATTSPAAWFTLTDGTGDPLLQLRLAAPALDLNTQLTRLRPNTIYYWTVSATPESATGSPRRAFILADAAAADAFAQELAGLPPGAVDSGWQRGFRAAWFFGRAKQR